MTALLDLRSDWTRSRGLRDVLARAAQTVDTHGWDAVLEDLERSLSRPSGDGSASTLSGVWAAADKVSRSAWTPVLAPLLAGFVATARPAADETRATPAAVWDSVEIPEAEHLAGPLSRARQRRFAAIVLSAQAAAVAAAAGDASPATTAFASGLGIPGGGFLATGQPVAAAATIVLFALALLLWFGTGNMALPGLIWVGAAGLAARRAHQHGTRWESSALAVAAVTTLTAWQIRRHRKATLEAQRAQAQAANEFLKVADRPLSDATRPESYVAAPLDDEQLALTRRFVDLAFQDHDNWSGWNVIDQFQPAALRYQINAVQDALAVQRFNRTPAFSGYLHEAHTRLFDRYLQRKVWGYWAWENLWGNLEWDPDPARRQNIMMTGYLAQSLGLYQAVSGDLRHSEPAALTFTWNERRSYPYDFARLCSNLTADYVRSPWGLVVCEPNWIFSLCNMRGATGLRLHDQVHGTTYWDQVREGYRRGFQRELVRPDGMVMGHRSSRVGFGAPGLSLSADLRPLVPNVANRGLLLLRSICRDAEGNVATPFRHDNSLLDAGNYSYNPLAAYGMVIDELREAGEEELAVGVDLELRERVSFDIDDRGWLNVDGASILAHAGYARASWGRHGGWLDLVENGRPEHTRNAPRLAAVSYPEVMVAQAVNPDAMSLTAVLSSRTNQPTTVALSHLIPRRTYDVIGMHPHRVTATDEGAATLTLDGPGRTEVSVTLTPEEAR